MFILGLQGSPKKNGNTSMLLNEFMKQAEAEGARTQIIEADRKNIIPCKEYKTCETKGFCPIKDDMLNEIYPKLWEADLIITASPVFFYSVTAQLKALIDRSQTQWARKYRLKLEDPGRKWRKGFLLALGATKGTNLFEGLELTARYFYDAVGAKYAGSLTYKQIEKPGDIKNHPTAFSEAREKAKELASGFIHRKTVLFVCRENACRSQMSQAFTRFYAGNRIEALSAGSDPADEVNSIMKDAMAEKGIDMYFRKPRSIDEVLKETKPDIIVTMGCEVSCPVVPDAEVIAWDLPDPEDKPMEFMRELRDNIEGKVNDLIKNIQ